MASENRIEAFCTPVRAGKVAMRFETKDGKANPDPRKISPFINPAAVSARLLSMSRKNGIRLSSRAMWTISLTGSGPTIIEYWNHDHPFWANVQCVFYNDPNMGHLIPKDIGARLIQITKQIHLECIHPSINPITRASGLHALIQLVAWICEIISWPLEFHRLDLHSKFWYRDDQLPVFPHIQNAMRAIVLSMSSGERELIYQRVGDLPIISGMEDVIWAVARANLAYNRIHLFDDIHVPLYLLEVEFVVPKGNA